MPWESPLQECRARRAAPMHWACMRYASGMLRVLLRDRLRAHQGQQQWDQVQESQEVGWGQAPREPSDGASCRWMRCKLPWTRLRASCRYQMGAWATGPTLDAPDAQGEGRSRRQQPGLGLCMEDAIGAPSLWCPEHPAQLSVVLGPPLLASR